MIRFLARRLVAALSVLWLVATLTFVLLRVAPGGPFDSDRNITPEVRRQLETHYRLDRSLAGQYADYLAGVLRGDLGPSFRYPTRRVTELLRMAAPVSFELGCYALGVALALGLAAGSAAALRPHSPWDHGAMLLASGGVCIPAFVLGPVLILLFAFRLEWLNPAGWFTWYDKVLPALTLGAYYAAFVARLTRAGLLDILAHDYIRTARAKGASEWRILTRHAPRTGLQPVLAYLGPACAGVLAGSFVVESIFRVPGLGRLFVTGAANRDYTLVLGVVLFYAALLVVLNMLVDLLQAWMDPRIRRD
jgi:oligopeptide transport system permease protein